MADLLKIQDTGLLTGLAAIQKANAALAALAGGLALASAPTAADLGLASLAGVSYYNTTSKIGYRRDLADTVWMPVYQVDETTKAVVWLSGGVPLYGASVQVTGSADALVATFHPAPAALVDGGLYPVRAAYANATTTPTININGLGAVTITKTGGTTLAIGDIKGANDDLLLKYNASANHLELIDPAGIGSWLPTAGGAMTGAINMAKGANVASAATCDIWTPGDGNLIHVTGTTAITSLGTAPQAGAHRVLVFDGALTLTNGANLILPGAANYTTAAGDMAFVYAETTTQHRVRILKADGTAVVAASGGGSAWSLKTTGSFSSATIIPFTGVSKTTRWTFRMGVVGSNHALTMRCSTNGGSSYYSDASYSGDLACVNPGAGTVYPQADSSTSVYLARQAKDASYGVGDSGGVLELFAQITLVRPEATSGGKLMMVDSVYQNSGYGQPERAAGFGLFNRAAAVNAVQFISSVATSGVYTVEEWQ